MSDPKSDEWPQVGNMVCDCRYKHVRVAERDGDEVILEDGAAVNIIHCGLETPDHEWAHPEGDAKLHDRD
jgi:hypothetical protein